MLKEYAIPMRASEAWDAVKAGRGAPASPSHVAGLMAKAANDIQQCVAMLSTRAAVSMHSASDATRLAFAIECEKLGYRVKLTGEWAEIEWGESNGIDGVTP